MRIGIVIPALNEAASIGEVVTDCFRHRGLDDNMRVVVCDNGSTDGTAEAARQGGAELVCEVRRGYGAACLRAIDHLGKWPDVLVFVDGDGSCDLGELARLLSPLNSGYADGVIGCRVGVERGALMPAQRFGNWLFCTLARWRWGMRIHDLGPFRAIRREWLARLEMSDTTWGWTLEMQIKACLRGLRMVEIPVNWRTRRGGCSKISGTLWGALRAGGKIAWTFLRHIHRRAAEPARSRNVIIVFVKYPQPGRVKTRLGAVVGYEKAAQIYRLLAERFFSELRALQASGLAEVVVYFDGGSTEDHETWLPGAARYQPQPDGVLTARLQQAFRHAFADGAHRVAAVGSDSPALTCQKVGCALEALRKADVAVIPNTDGGYALIAMSRYYPSLFEGVEWSTPSVLGQTRERAAKLALSVHELPAIADIDTVDDLPHLPPELLQQFSAEAPTLQPVRIG